jgi:thioredoxin reductase (NADPH)
MSPAREGSSRSAPTRATAQPKPQLRMPDHLVPDEPSGTRPAFSVAQLERLAQYGVEEVVRPGDLVFADGDVGYDLVLILEGCVEVVEFYATEREVVISRYGPGEFPGEISLLTGQRVFLTAVVRDSGRVVRVAAPRVHEIIGQEPDLSELILRALLARHARLTTHGAGLTLIGSRFQPDTRRLLSVLARNRLSSRWLDPEDSGEARETLDALKVPARDTPIVLIPGQPLMRKPSTAGFLRAIGLDVTSADEPVSACDVVIVGGGPGGLAAAVYAASEGLTTTLVEGRGLGGQAGTSSRIENLLGFPAGLSGEELTARAMLQAQKFGAEIRVSCHAATLRASPQAHQIELDDGTVLAARTIIIATGVEHNGLPVARISDFEGVGVFYAATQMEAQACNGEVAAIVGGGNSAGQAALYLSRACEHVHILIRRPDLSSSMSHYLIEQIDRTPNITVHPRTEVTELEGHETLQGVHLRTADGDGHLPVQALFLFTGARPNTAWLGGQLAVDDHGFIVTGEAIPAQLRDPSATTPLPLETSCPGVFCIGDVRSGSIKRVATGVGEGSMAVRLIFDRLQTA